MNMKRIGFTFLIAMLGGLLAVGGYKLFESKQAEKMTFEESQQVYFANNPTKAISSTGNPDFVQASAAVTPAVVNIETTYTRKGSSRGQGQSSPFDMFEEFFGAPRGRQQPSQPSRASGSGVIISTDGYIITNNHVVENADKIEVKLTDKRILEAKLIGRDPNTDLALLKVSSQTPLPIVKLGDSDAVNIGEWVLAVGYPLGLESTVTAGIVSAKGRALNLLGQEQRQQQYYEDPSTPPVNTAIESFIQTDAVINRGNSGGALVNANGELIGINSAIMSPSGFYAGYGFAIPVNLVKKIANDFKEFGEVKRGFIGVTFTELSRDVAKELEINETSGLYVQDVVEGGGAEKAGIQKADVITHIDGNLIVSSSVLQERVGRMRPGDKVELTYLRQGKQRKANITLQDAKTTVKESKAVSKSTVQLYNDLGAGFQALSQAKKKELGVTSGMVLSQVRKGGLFDLYGVPAGLVITDINGTPINNIDQIEKALGKSSTIIKINGISPDGARVQLMLPVK